MSVHPSLSPRGKGKRTRSVHKRFERLKELEEKEKWQPGDSVFGLPKVKTQRRKLKKAKKAADAESPEAQAEKDAAGAETAKKEEKSTKK
ncbi:MAG: small basic protein [Candidatus Omnitrophica bacterium]|nr:small basic protein [Candidatus Omnitrophota bacterium]